MNFLELEIEQIIWDAIQNNQHTVLEERGLPITDDYTYVRQLDLCGYGRADLVGFHTGILEPGFMKARNIDIQILELKKDKIDINTLLQAVRYAKGLKEKFKHEKLNYYSYFTIYLIGKTIDTSTDFVFLPDLFPRIHLITYSIDLFKGINFRYHSDYLLHNASFRKESNDLIPILKKNLIKNLTYIDEPEQIEEQDTEQEIISPDEIIENDLPF